MDDFDGPLQGPRQQLRGIEDVAVERRGLVAVVPGVERREDAGLRTPFRAW